MLLEKNQGALLIWLVFLASLTLKVNLASIFHLEIVSEKPRMHNSFVILLSQFEEVLNQPDPIEELQKVVDPRLGENYPLDSVRKVKYSKKKAHYSLSLDISSEITMVVFWCRWPNWQKHACIRIKNCAQVCDLLLLR